LEKRTSNDKTDNDRANKRRPYHSPEMESEPLFDGVNLSCGYTALDGTSNCDFSPQTI